MTASRDLPAHDVEGLDPDPTPADSDYSPLGFRLVVAPAAGKVRHQPPARFQDGVEWIAAGQVIAVIEQGSSSVRVEAPISGRMAGVLVRDGTPVLPGQPLLTIEHSPGPPEPPTGQDTP